MRRYWKRLTLAMALSISCAAATLYWYKKTKPVYSVSSQAPIAQVERVTSEAQKRPPTRLLWQPLGRGDNLYSGETIHTSPRGDMRIQFEDGRYIDVEPDSLVVMEKAENEIAMDLLEGSLFVNSQAQGAKTSLVLRSEMGNVDLSGSKAALGKSATGKIDIEVVSGTAKVRGKDGKKQEISSGAQASLTGAGLQDQNRFKAVSPKHGSSLLLGGADGDPAQFSWKGAEAKWRIALWLGDTRRSLAETDSTASGTATSLSRQVEPGKRWWKLVATDPATRERVAETPAYRVDIVRALPPTPVFPQENAEIQATAQGADVAFRWRKPEWAESSTIEVFGSAPEAKPIAQKAIAQQDSWTLAAMREGKYSWRLSARLAGAPKPIVGPLRRFSVLPFKPAVVPAEIAWKLPGDKAEQAYPREPELSLGWQIKSRQAEIAKLALKVQGSDKADIQTINLDPVASTATVPVRSPGRYIASIEAYDKSGALIGGSKPEQLTLAKLPLLPMPNLRQPAGSAWKSTGRGRLEVGWDDVPGAKSYVVAVEGAGGAEAARYEASSPRAALKGILPGSYKVRVWAIDGFGRDGRAAQASLEVPRQSDVRAPTVKGIKVE